MRVDGYVTCARLEDGEQSDDHFRCAVEAESDEVAFAHITSGEIMRQSVGILFELAVGQAAILGYDRYPELLIDEKRALLDDLVARGGRLFFTHDPDFAMARVVRDDRGRFTTADDVAAAVALPV